MKYLFLWLFFTSTLYADHIILCGRGGDPQYTEQFTSWGSQLRDLLVGKMGVNQDQVHFFLEPDQAKGAGGKALDLEALRVFFEGLAKKHDRDEGLYVYLIGHGSYLKGQAKFQLPGPDLTAEQLNTWVSATPYENLVLINTASSGAGFLNVLSGPSRVICSATRSVGEKSAPQFMAHFLTGLEDGSADRDRDTRISVYEAASQAAALTGAWYLSEGLIATEHAILDDNGDALGERLDSPIREDGKKAREVFLKSFSFPAAAPQNLVDQYLAAMKEVEALRIRKKSMSSDAYLRQLEMKILKAARLHQKIRAAGEE